MICKYFKIVKQLLLIERAFMVSKTKIVGISILITAVAKIVCDAFDGNGFAFQANIDSLIYAMNGLGFFFLRDAVKKIKDVAVK